MQLIEIFRGKVIDVAEKTFVIEVTGSGDKIDAFEKQMEAFGIRELVRTGTHRDDARPTHGLTFFCPATKVAGNKSTKPPSEAADYGAGLFL
jgi:hypothetical protein